MTYWVSLRVRVSSDTPLSYYVQIKGPKADGSGWVHKKPLDCPAQTRSDGWVTCSGPYVVEDELSSDVIEGDIHFEVIPDYKIDNGPIWSTVDYDDISMSFMSGVSTSLLVFLATKSLIYAHLVAIIATLLPQPAEGLSLDNKVVSKWGAKADVHITSSTLRSEDSQDAVIESVVSNTDGHATVKLETGIETVLDEQKTPGMGVEVVLLSRNIKIQGADDGVASQGGYFQVFHTPGVAQTIEGVEFNNMGQKKGKNRFALQFLYSGNVIGTSIARNSIRNSSHRCIVIEGSSNITIEANVAHETAGHCYYVGEDSTDNKFLSNIGSRTNTNIRWGDHVNGRSLVLFSVVLFPILIFS